MMPLRQLILRSNRFLGSALVERGLIDQGLLEEANERLIDLLQRETVDRPCLLRILIYDLKALDEGDLFDALSQGAPVGMVDLSHVNIHLPGGVTPEECAATGSIPFDHRERHHFIATTYYLSKPVRDYWNERLEGELVWLIALMEQMDSALEDLTGKPAPDTRPPLPRAEDREPEGKVS